MTYIVFMAGTHTTDTPAGKAHTMETLMTTDSIGEAIETARALHAMAIDAGNTDAAAIVYVVDMDHTDPLTGVTLRHEFEVIASAHRPRRGTVLFAGGALTPEA